MATPSIAQPLSTVVPRLKKLSIVKTIVLLVVVGLLSAELLCRFAIGLGDPPLYQADGQMEYLLQPSRTYYRFHHRFSVNQYGMRADNFPPKKSSPNELRVMVVGDSIIYGGV